MGDPTDFTKAWPMSDVVIRTMNSNDVCLHASKSLLAIFSPYFQAMFFGGFKEKDAEQVELQEDFTVVHNALRILHQDDKTDPCGPNKVFSPSELFELYQFADKCDVPKIRELCKAQLVQKKVKEALEVAVQLGLDDVKSKLVESLDKSVLKEYLNANDQDRTFSSADVNVLVKKLTTTIIQKVVEEVPQAPKTLYLCNCRNTYSGSTSAPYYNPTSGRCSYSRTHNASDPPTYDT